MGYGVMGSSDDIDQLLNTAEGYVPRIGDEIEEAIEGRTAEGDRVEGYSCSHGTHSYIVAGSPAWEFVQVQYPVKIDHAVALRTSKKQVDELGQVSFPNEKVREARERLEEELQATPPSERKKVRLNLMQIICREGVVVDLDTTEPFNIHGFTLSKRVFLNEEGVGITEFDTAVQSVVNLGWVGKDFLLENYGLLEETEGGAHSGQDDF